MKKPIFTVRELVVCAMLVALFVVQAVYLRIYLVPDQIRISFEFLPLVIAAYLFGPMPAMLMGGAGDFLANIWRPGYTPFFTIIYAVGGLILGLLIYNRKKVWQIILACLTYSLVVDIILSSGVLYLIFNSPQAIIWRVAKCAVMMVAYPLVAIPLLKFIDKVYKRKTV